MCKIFSSVLRSVQQNMLFYTLVLRFVQRNMKHNVSTSLDFSDTSKLFNTYKAIASYLEDIILWKLKNRYKDASIVQILNLDNKLQRTYLQWHHA